MAASGHVEGGAHTSFIYVVTSYRDPEQLYRLCLLLRSQTRGRIIVSHDRKGPRLDERLLESNSIILVRTRKPIYWGDGSYLDSILDVLQSEGRANGRQWFTILTSTDYPLRPLAQYEEHLVQTGADALLEPVQHGAAYENLLNRYRRYAIFCPSWLGGSPWQPLLMRTIGKFPGVSVTPRPHGLGPILSLPRRTPFGPKLILYKGCDLFAVNEASVAALLAARETLGRYFKRTQIPSEAFPHTVLRNNPNLAVRSEMIHYAEWRNSAHPSEIDEHNLEKALESARWFARKFAPSSPLLDGLDASLGSAEGGATS